MKGETAEPIGSAFLCPLSAAPGLDDNIYYIVRTRTIGARPIEARPRPDPTWVQRKRLGIKIIPNKIDYGNRW